MIDAAAGDGEWRTTKLLSVALRSGNATSNRGEVMLRHDQNASSVDEAVDPSKEKDGRPDMIDRAPRVRLCRSSNLINTTSPRGKRDT
jgi:hypothetical protein